MAAMTSVLAVPTSSKPENGAVMKKTLAQAIQIAVASRPANQPRYQPATVTAPKIQM